jgi:hypothetical protein
MPRAPTANRPTAAKIDQTYASLPKPSGCPSSAALAERRSATSRKTSLPVSAHECAASATSDAEPVITAATVFAMAISRFAPNAITTVSTAATRLLAVLSLVTVQR